MFEIPVSEGSESPHYLTGQDGGRSWISGSKWLGKLQREFPVLLSLSSVDVLLSPPVVETAFLKCVKHRRKERKKKQGLGKVWMSIWSQNGEDSKKHRCIPFLKRINSYKQFWFCGSISWDLHCNDREISGASVGGDGVNRIQGTWKWSENREDPQL